MVKARHRLSSQDVQTVPREVPSPDTGHVLSRVTVHASRRSQVGRQIVWYVGSLASVKRTGHWLHGFLDLCLLASLRTGPDYGFALAQRLAETGLGEVPGGTLYPALLRLEQRSWVSVSWVASESGPRRKYYALTGAGQTVLDRDTTRWQQFRDSIDEVVGVSVVPIPGRAPSQTRPSGGGR